jgi:hypothetical protein
LSFPAQVFGNEMVLLMPLRENVQPVLPLAALTV